jgi:toxin ParE1/3/4
MTRRKIVISSVASDDIAALLHYAMAHATLEAATKLDALLDEALASLERLADRGRIVPELQVRGISTYREVIRGTYRIVYRVMAREVWVLAVVDGRRDLDGLLFERARR